MTKVRYYRMNKKSDMGQKHSRVSGKLIDENSFELTRREEGHMIGRPITS